MDWQRKHDAGLRKERLAAEQSTPAVVHSSAGVNL